MHATARRLREALAANNRLVRELDAPGFPLSALCLLQDWQRQRLQASFADLAKNSRYRAANRFFLAELYGGLNFRERDRDVERVLPVMTRTLPPAMQKTLAKAMELQALSLEFDMAMAKIIKTEGWESLDVSAYGKVYRRLGRRVERRKQIEMIRHLGLELDQFVRLPLVLGLIKMLRGPARAAGFGALQTFLENGLNAFSAMGSASEYVEIICRREARSMEKLFAADPDPFR